MLELPTPSSTRFVRSLYDVDRTKPSPFGWKRCSSQSPRRYVRRMGLVESFFHTMATLHQGRTDIFYRLPLSCSAHAYEQLVRRLPLAWALLCRRHPLLSAHVETLTPDGSLLDPREAASRRHAGEAANDASSSFEPHFVCELPETAADLLEQASRRLVCLPDTWKEDLTSSARSRGSDAAVAWLDQYVWNGKRRFLDQHAAFGLARLILLPPSPSNSSEDDVRFDLILCTAHCISDGLSVSSLAGELLQLLSSPQLPLELPKLVTQPETSTQVRGASLARYSTITDDIKQSLLSGLFASSQPGNLSDSSDQLTEAHFASLLPPPIEATYPEFLPAPPIASAGRLARTRWFWTIRRAICQIRAGRAEKAILSDFKANHADKNVKEPWWGAQTKWSVVRLSTQDTLALTQVAKRKRVRVGSLLYAVAACALNTLEKRYTSSEDRAEQPTTTVIGFPFSTRRFLDTRAAVDTLQAVGASDPLLPPSSLGVKLGFSGVGLPPADLFSLPATPSSLIAFHAAQLWQTARQVQKQFDAMFKEPRFMHADGFLLGLERETRFRQNGVKDVFQVFKDEDEDEAVAGQDERRPGLTKKNMQGPGSSLNFSMVGLLDAVIPCDLALPFAAAAKLQVRQGLMFGVRNRAGEAFGTSFTFRGQLNLELGHDTVVWDTVKVEEYLSLMKTILEAIVAFEL
ncbi:conserved hypothetical protein [Sporisorium reilianum SRZ2]|uniref:Alcohol acetyltransferase n=1 Tax=Sporisorium reilianum (strain SRZ2) TaxID=999809 RepID=E6ZSS9_SPORE|nr:conserved hypothetical protein [Sporisorium reilianum SRZ2]